MTESNHQSIIDLSLLDTKPLVKEYKQTRKDLKSKDELIQNQTIHKIINNKRYYIEGEILQILLECSKIKKVPNEQTKLYSTTIQTFFEHENIDHTIILTVYNTYKITNNLEIFTILCDNILNQSNLKKKSKSITSEEAETQRLLWEHTKYTSLQILYYLYEILTYPIIKEHTHYNDMINAYINIPQLSHTLLVYLNELTTSTSVDDAQNYWTKGIIMTQINWILTILHYICINNDQYRSNILQSNELYTILYDILTHSLHINTDKSLVLYTTINLIKQCICQPTSTSIVDSTPHIFLSDVDKSKALLDRMGNVLEIYAVELATPPAIQHTAGGTGATKGSKGNTATAPAPKKSTPTPATAHKPTTATHLHTTTTTAISTDPTTLNTIKTPIETTRIHVLTIHTILQIFSYTTSTTPSYFDEVSLPAILSSIDHICNSPSLLEEVLKVPIQYKPYTTILHTFYHELGVLLGHLASLPTVRQHILVLSNKTVEILVGLIQRSRGYIEAYTHTYIQSHTHIDMHTHIQETEVAGESLPIQVQIDSSIVDTYLYEYRYILFKAMLNLWIRREFDGKLWTYTTILCPLSATTTISVTTPTTATLTDTGMPTTAERSDDNGFAASATPPLTPPLALPIDEIIIKMFQDRFITLIYELLSTYTNDDDMIRRVVSILHHITHTSNYQPFYTNNQIVSQILPLLATYYTTYQALLTIELTQISEPKPEKTRPEPENVVDVTDVTSTLQDLSLTRIEDNITQPNATPINTTPIINSSDHIPNSRNNNTINNSNSNNIDNNNILNLGIRPSVGPTLYYILYTIQHLLTTTTTTANNMEDLKVVATEEFITSLSHSLHILKIYHSTSSKEEDKNKEYTVLVVNIMSLPWPSQYSPLTLAQTHAQIQAQSVNTDDVKFDNNNDGTCAINHKSVLLRPVILQTLTLLSSYYATNHSFEVQLEATGGPSSQPSPLLPYPVIHSPVKYISIMIGIVCGDEIMSIFYEKQVHIEITNAVLVLLKTLFHSHPEAQSAFIESIAAAGFTLPTHYSSSISATASTTTTDLIVGEGTGSSTTGSSSLRAWYDLTYGPVLSAAGVVEAVEGTEVEGSAAVVVDWKQYAWAPPRTFDQALPATTITTTDDASGSIPVASAGVVTFDDNQALWPYCTLISGLTNLFTDKEVKREVFTIVLTIISDLCCIDYLAEANQLVASNICAMLFIHYGGAVNTLGYLGQHKLLAPESLLSTLTVTDDSTAAVTIHGIQDSNPLEEVVTESINTPQPSAENTTVGAVAVAHHDEEDKVISSIYTILRQLLLRGFVHDAYWTELYHTNQAALEAEQAAATAANTKGGAGKRKASTSHTTTTTVDAKGTAKPDATNKAAIKGDSKADLNKPKNDKKTDKSKSAPPPTISPTLLKYINYPTSILNIDLPSLPILQNSTPSGGHSFIYDPNKGPTKQLWSNLINSKHMDYHLYIQSSTILHSSVLAKNRIMTDFLLNHLPEVEINKQDNSGKSVLMYAYLLHDSNTITTLLSRSSLLVNQCDNGGNPLLKYAFLSPTTMPTKHTMPATPTPTVPIHDLPLINTTPSTVTDSDLTVTLSVPTTGTYKLDELLNLPKINISQQDSTGNHLLHWLLGSATMHTQLGNRTLTLNNSVTVGVTAAAVGAVEETAIPTIGTGTSAPISSTDTTEAGDRLRVFKKLVTMNSELLRVANHQGITILHLICGIHDKQLLHELLYNCPTDWHKQPVDNNGHIPLHYLLGNNIATNHSPEYMIAMYDMLIRRTGCAPFITPASEHYTKTDTASTHVMTHNFNNTTSAEEQNNIVKTYLESYFSRQLTPVSLCYQNTTDEVLLYTNKIGFNALYICLLGPLACPTPHLSPTLHTLIHSQSTTTTVDALQVPDSSPEPPAGPTPVVAPTVPTIPTVSMYTPHEKTCRIALALHIINTISTETLRTLTTINNIYNIDIIHALNILQQGPPLPKQDLTDKQIRANRKSIVYFESIEVELVYRLTTAAHMSINTTNTTTSTTTATSTTDNTTTAAAVTTNSTNEVEGLTMTDLNLNLQ